MDWFTNTRTFEEVELGVIVALNPVSAKVVLELLTGTSVVP
jgi:hypothetical protein